MFRWSFGHFLRCVFSPGKGDCISVAGAGSGSLEYVPFHANDSSSRVSLAHTSLRLNIHLTKNELRQRATCLLLVLASCTRRSLPCIFQLLSCAAHLQHGFFSKGGGGAERTARRLIRVVCVPFQHTPYVVRHLVRRQAWCTVVRSWVGTCGGERYEC